MESRPRDRASPLARPEKLIELFVTSNLAFLALDVYLAHLTNRFAHPAEWIPFAFSLGSPPVLLAALAVGGLDPRRSRLPGLVVGWASVAVGVAGLLYHLDDAFFEDQTLKNLVYTAPFVAPLAYCGLGLLSIMNRMVAAGTVEWGRWVLLLALGGFAGNLVLSLCDHAQNGFFDRREWISVAAGAAAVGFLTTALVRFRERPFLTVCLWVLAAEAVVGALGFYFHLAADLGGPDRSLVERFIYGAPVFAPLLFADLAVLAAIGLAALLGPGPNSYGARWTGASGS